MSNTKTARIHANEALAREWLFAFNAHDVSRLVSLYWPEAIHYSPKLLAQKPETRGEIRGREALTQWWTSAMERMPSLHYAFVSVTANERRAFLEYVRRVEGDEDLDVAELFEIERGRILRSRVYHG